jgi:hypothetical protein
MDDAERTAQFAKYLDERFQGEVYGEAVFAAMAEACAGAETRYQWRVLEALERETKEYLARALRERSLPAEPSPELRAQGEKLGRTLAGVPRELFMKGFRGEVSRFVSEYEAAEASVPEDGLEIARHVTAHERAILDFADRELEGRTSDSLEPVIAFLADPPAR